MSSISTKRGDDGTTSLLYGQRVSKSHPQIEAVGAIDELNVAIGALRAAGIVRVESSAAGLIGSIQQNLVALMGEVSCAESDRARYEQSKFAKLSHDDVSRLDAEVAAIESRLPPAKGWVMPGGNAAGLVLEQARVAARRAERRVVGLAETGRRLRPECISYLNRLSDLLWLLAREAEQ